ncbi:Mov34/MPN/PAD-1 family protein [Pontixanthobacter gangjinensis]|uniref:Peptidase n=1 Tax=Pontixanthobacter gangjinensis TaxID=1028742 RepID=A0A6I4SLM1_9SPHN|nr:M67 family metallopeptidase [Pontixanthobacter gangjinensis]MXO56328.1 peptidase [Pontixanthobacter gangjinensis]
MIAQRFILNSQGDLPVPQSVHGAMCDLAGKSAPQECCGILVGEGGVITRLIESENVHPTPETHFEIDPETLIDAYRSERRGGPEVLGFFHSHPSGDPAPSETDQAMAAGDGRIWAIVGVSGVMFWEDKDSGFAALSYTVLDN